MSRISMLAIGGGFAVLGACGSLEVPTVDAKATPNAVTARVGETFEVVTEVESNYAGQLDHWATVDDHTIVAMDEGTVERDVEAGVGAKVSWPGTCRVEGKTAIYFNARVTRGEEEGSARTRVEVDCVGETGTGGGGAGGTGGSGGGGNGGGGAGGTMLDGDLDPVDDCETDTGPDVCDPEMDIVEVASGCVNTDGAVRVAFAGPLEALPAGAQERTVTFSSADGTQDVKLFTRADGGAYNCQYINNNVYEPLPAGAICEVNAADDTFDFYVTEVGFPIATVEVYSSGYPDGGVFKWDVAGPFVCE